MTMSKRIMLLALVVLGIGVVSVAAIAASDDAIRPPDASEQAVATVEPVAADSFDFLNEQQTDADRVPANIAANVRLPYGANVELSRRVAWGNGTEVFAIPGRGFICTIVPNPDGSTGGCQPTDAIASGVNSGPALVHSAKIDQVYAVVPDGVESVTLGLESGKTVDVAVQDGGYYAEVSTEDPARTVSYGGPNGAVTQQVPIPPDEPLG